MSTGRYQPIGRAYRAVPIAMVRIIVKVLQSVVLRRLATQKPVVATSAVRSLLLALVQQ